MVVARKKKRKTRKKKQGDEVRAEIQINGSSMIVRPLFVSLSDEQLDGICTEAKTRGIQGCKVVYAFPGKAFALPLATATAGSVEQLVSLFSFGKPQLATAK
ncbi:hypothetical protein A3I27_00335 [Candidatus Giovannonibacteria bacterium RIFCSPLOWO2_02_FULL_43_11b]|nr:MAG: hypothetical protein A3I27_00335 [Candidatus Giovannonibacteria bacterium RIFCSPLOWO2_02_FULL_43_11b]